MPTNKFRISLLVLLVTMATLCRGGYDDRAQRCPSSNFLPYTTEMLPHPYREVCYQFVHRETYWSVASDFCRRYGGRLVSIPDADTNYFILEKLNRLPWKNRGVWIGLHDRDDEMVWEWSTESEHVGGEVTWTNWGRGHPRASFHGIRDCVRMVRGSGTWRWHETPCALLNWKYRSICQYQMLPKPSTPSRRVDFTSPTPKTTTRITTTLPPKSTTTLKYGVGENGLFGAFNNDAHNSATKEAHTHDVTTENHIEMLGIPTNVVVPLQLQQDNGASDKKMLGGVVVACMIMVLLALLVITVVYFRRRRRQKSGIPSSLIVENPAYHGTDCNGTQTVVVANGQTTILKLKAINENEYTDEPRGGHRGLILPYKDNIGDDKYSEVRSLYSSPSDQNNTNEETENKYNPTYTGHEYSNAYDVPKSNKHTFLNRPKIAPPSEYLPMDRHKGNENTFKLPVGDYLEPVSSSRISNIYAEIPGDEEDYIEENVYECLDDVEPATT